MFLRFVLLLSYPKKLEVETILSRNTHFVVAPGITHLHKPTWSSNNRSGQQLLEQRLSMYI